jgi:peptide/nickel transport system substrate-binding protein
MKKSKGTFLSTIALCLAVLSFVGCQRTTNQGGVGSANASESEQAMKNGWLQNWYDTPTAAEMGIKTFSEAPMLADLVKVGKLPPVEQRIPFEDALVIQSLDGNAKYGGDMRVARMGPGDWGDGHRAKESFLFVSDPTMNELIPYVAKDYKISDNSDSLTIYLRRGMRWSDGEPFTADDIIFRVDEMWNNPDMISFDPYPPNMMINGQKSIFRKIDDYTIEVQFSGTLPQIKIIGMFNWLRQFGAFAVPAHFIKQYMPKFNPNADALAKSEGFATWQLAVQAHINLNPNQAYTQPELGAWVLKEVTDQGNVWERNPYFFAVDEKGRQLPYIDRMVTRYYTDSQVAILDAMQGNIDFIGRMLDPSNLPVYKENESKGNYTTYDWFSTKMAAIGFRFNFSYQDKILANLMWDVRFRQALSVAINRSEINQLVFLGLGAPQQMTIKGASFYREGWDQYYAQYDPALAKKLLGEMGLKTSSDGFFLRPDGKPLELTLIVSTEALVGPIGQKIAELTAQYWEEIGVRTIVRPQETSLYYALMNNGDLSIFVWPSESDIEVRTVADVWSFSVNPKSPLGYAPEWGKWFVHDSWEKEGRFGAAPPK